MAASGSRTLPNHAFAKDDEAGGSLIVGYELDAVIGSGRVSASILDIASGSRALPREAFAEDEKDVEAGQGSLLADNATTSTRQT